MNHTCMNRAPQALQGGRNGYRFGSRFAEISVPEVGGGIGDRPAVSILPDLEMSTGGKGGSQGLLGVGPRLI